MPASMAEREQFRSLSVAKVQLSEQNTKQKEKFFYYCLVFSSISTFDDGVKGTQKNRNRIVFAIPVLI